MFEPSRADGRPLAGFQLAERGRSAIVPFVGPDHAVVAHAACRWTEDR